MDALTFLGTGCGVPMTDRFHTSLLLEAQGRRWLLDAGEPSSHRLKHLGVPLSSLDGIFISHGHSDHLSGLPMIIQGAWLENRRRPLPLYLPAELIAPIRSWLEAVYLPDKLIGFPLEYHPWETLPDGGVSLDEGRLRVTTNPSSHLYGLRTLIDPAATDRFLAYSLAFDWPEIGRRFVFSADLGRPEDMEAILAAPCDVLVCELSHFNPEELFTFLETKPARRLYLTHLTAEFSADAERICALGRRMLPGWQEIRVVRDGERVEF